MEVEVLHDSQDLHESGKIFHEENTDVRKEVGKYLEKVKHIPADVEKEVIGEFDAAKEETTRLRDDTVRGIRHVEDTLTKRHDKHEGDESSHEPEHEGDWQDVEDEEGENTRGRLLTDERVRPSPKPRRPKIRIVSGKRRDGLRHASGKSKTQPATPTSPMFEEGEGEGEEKPARGRDMSRSRSVGDLAEAGRTQPASASHHRSRHATKDSISRLIHEAGHHRAESPARSIRFADQQPPSEIA